MNTYQSFVKALKSNWSINELPTSPLLRNDNSYFTFSPFQDTEENFKLLSCSQDLYVKYQPTIRKLNTIDLTNPLNMNFQVTYSVQNYKRKNQLSLIKDLIEVSRQTFYPNIKDSDIQITYPDILHEYLKDAMIPFELNEVKTTDRYISKLDIPGKHFYLKVRMKFKTGSINVVDFVLVDYNPVNFTSQLDSIWVEDLIDLLNEDRSFIFDENKYKNEKQIVKEYTNVPRDQHVIINDIRTILKVMSLGVMPATKGINSEVKRKIRKLYFYYYFYIDQNVDGLLDIIQKISNYEDYSKNILQILTENIKKVENNYRKAIRTAEKSHMNRKIAQSSLGIPDEYYGDYLKNWHSEYNF